MPPRWATLIILGFWLFATAWLTVREIAPRWRAGQPPPYTIDLTDEVGQERIYWKLFRGDDKLVGKAESSIRVTAERTFELQTELWCDKISALKSLHLVNKLRIDGAGTLLGLAVKVECRAPIIGFVEAEISGNVENGEVQPEVRARAQGLEHTLRGAKASVRGSILNSMQVLNKISGLREGQRWSEPLLEPLRFLPLGAPADSIPRVDAEVTADVLAWSGAEVPCFVIEYREPQEQRLTAKTWVRQSDGLVLQQLAAHAGIELTLVRDPAK